MAGIVVGHDGSETSEKAMLEAARLAEGLGLPLHIVVAYKRAGAAKVPDGDAWTIGGLDDAEEVIAQAATRYGGNIEVTHSVSTDDPADALVDAAEELDADMIVVGNRRVQGISRVLGSVASNVMRKASCSVHVAHTTG